MTTSALLQSLIVGACVAFAAMYMLGRYAPKLVAIPRAWLARRLERSGLQRAAALLQPKAASGGGCHSGGDAACSSCGSCGSPQEAAPKESPVIFHRRS